jgi:hypothetical protein
MVNSLTWKKTSVLLGLGVQWDDYHSILFGLTFKCQISIIVFKIKFDNKHGN